MTRQRKAVLWFALCLSLPGAAYASLGVVYFVWLGGVQQQSARTAGVFAIGALALAVLCAGLFLYCLLALVRNARRPEPAPR